MAFFSILCLTGRTYRFRILMRWSLRKDTSYKGLWTVSFTLKEM